MSIGVKLKTLTETASILNVHPQTLRNKIKSQKIGCVCQGGRFFFTDTQIQTYINTHSLSPNPRPDFSLLSQILKCDKLDREGGSELMSKSTTRWNYSIHGLGGIYIRKDTGTPCIYYYDGYGKRQRETLRGITDLQQAKQVLHDRIKESLDRKYSPHKQERRIKFAEFVTIYLERYAKLRKRSWKTDERYCKNHLTPFFGHQYVDEVGLEHIQEFMFKKLESGLRKNSVNRYLQIMRCMLNRAKDFGYLMNDNPVKRGVLFNEAEFIRTRVLSHEEEGRLMSEASEHLKPIVRYALLSGCRLQEILGLHTDDIDFRQNTVTIRPEINKSGKRDLIPIHEELRVFLENHLNNHNGSEHVFTHTDCKTGEVKPLKHIYRGFHRACERAGIKDIQFRDLRTTVATRWHERGVDPLIISRAVLRHSTFKMSEQYYIHSQTEFMRESLNNANGNKAVSELTRKERESAFTPVN